jgi:quercetin dioxygenase-like cupin family protein
MKLLPLACTAAILLPLAITCGRLASAAHDNRAQDEVAVDPELAKVEFENDQIRVLRISYAPHQKSETHNHPSRCVVTITKTDARVSFPDGRTQNTVRPAHQLFWSEPVTHQVENVSANPMMNIEVELKQAKSPSVEVKPVAAASKAQGTETDPVAVEQEPHHHIVFENQYVRVLDVVVNPGDTTLFHTHSLDNLAVQLSDAMIKRQYPGQPWVDAPAKEGSVGFNAGTQKPYTHRITNAGTSVFHVLDIEILPVT